MGALLSDPFTSRRLGSAMTHTKTHPVIRLLCALTVGGLLAQLPFWPTLALGAFLMLWIFHITEG